MITLNLPEPPSVNEAYVNVRGKGRTKTVKYKQWETECLWMIKAAKPGIIKGEYMVVLFLSQKTRKDVDNCLKPALDLLAKCGVTEDDKYCYSVTSAKSPDVHKGKCKIVIRPKNHLTEFPFICVAERAEKAAEELAA